MQGETATRIWEAIYSQSCFTNISDPDTCTERRVFYRLISGADATPAAPGCCTSCWQTVPRVSQRASYYPVVITCRCCVCAATQHGCLDGPVN